MIVEKIRRARGYLEISAEGRTFEILESDADLYDLHEGNEAQEEVLERLHEKCRYARAKERALCMLDRRDYAAGELCQKLRQTYPEKALCQRIVRELEESGLLDDARYARELARHLVENKRYGTRRARQEMLRRGLSRALIDSTLPAYEDTALENLPLVLEKRYGRILDNDPDARAREKVTAGMVRLGYDAAPVRAAIKAYALKDEEEGEL